MNLKEAVIKLTQGERIKRKSWDIQGYPDIFLFGDKIYRRMYQTFQYSFDIINSTGWVIYDDPEEKEMDFAEAIEQLTKNKFLRSKEWPKTTYIKLSENKKDFYITAIEECNATLTFEDFTANDWEIINE